jgi:6-pyruvoyltetrahydropterin/6-carboxytetrahydropterin synthase
MFSLSKQVRFEAAHQLPYHQGKCARLHGHSWLVTLTVEGEELQQDGPQKGMLADFDILGNMTADIFQTFDHSLLNPRIHNPTSENLAVFIYYQLLAPSISKLPPGVQLTEIRVDETCTCACVFRPQK